MADATHYLDDEPEAGFALTPGFYVSGVAHAGLLVWLLAGWGLSQEPLPFETIDVSVVSSAEYAALVNRGNPEIDPIEPVALTAPEVETLPEVTPEEPVVPVQQEAAPEVPVDEVPPEALEPVPVPEEVTDEVVVLEPPSIPAAPEVPDQPIEDEAQEEAAPRVAAEAAPLPPLNTDVAPQVQLESTPEAETAEVVEEETEATAPEQAATEIVTEAEEPSAAPLTSLRPAARPARPAPAVEVETPAEPGVAAETPVEDTTLDDLLADVAAEQPAEVPAQEVAGESGPPMTAGQMDAFGRAITPCWLVDPGSISATITVTVSFQLGQDRRVVGSVVELVSNTPGEPAAVRAAFEKARVAVLNCQRQGGGFPLDEAQFEQWRNVEMTFNPSEMRIR